MTNLMDAVDVCRCLRVACQTAGGQQAWAQANGISAQYVSDVLNGRREPGQSILSALGFVRIVRYQRAPQAKSGNRRSEASQ